MVRITDRGRKVAAAHPDRVDIRVLSEFPEFIDFKSRSRPPKQTGEPDRGDEGWTPREAVSTAVDEANAAVAAEVLDRVRQREPAFLGRLMLTVLTAMGYGGAAGAAEHLGRSGDEGLDGVIRQDPLGLDRIYVKAKRYGAGKAVGRPGIQEFVGALHGAQADRGIFITADHFHARGGHVRGPGSGQGHPDRRLGSGQFDGPLQHRRARPADLRDQAGRRRFL